MSPALLSIKKGIFVQALLLLGFSYSSSLFAQCADQRYVDEVFSSAERTLDGVIYNTAPTLLPLCLIEFFTYSEDYRLDVYEPVGDSLDKRPCIIYAHGGAFAIGDRRMDPVPDFCYAMARRGFVVVSIDYRKCFNPLSESSSVRAVYRAIQDMRAAVRYVKEIAPSIGVDTNYVFAGGNSAGSFMALHATYGDDDERADLAPASFDFPNLGCFDCTGNSFTHDGRPDAVINLWGAILDTAAIEPGDPPVISFHGGLDFIVSPYFSPPFSWPVFPSVYGSDPIFDRVQNLGIPSKYFFYPLEGHELWSLSLFAGSNFNEIVRESSQFLNDELLKPETTSISGPAEACTSSPTSYSVSEELGSTYCWEVSGGVISSSSASGASVEVLWSSAGSGLLTVTETNSLGSAGDASSLSVNISNDCCPAPSGLSSTVLSDNAASLNWDIVPEALAYEIQGGKVGGIVRSKTLLSNSIDLNTLDAATDYAWNVRSLCAADTSSYSATALFTTTGARLANAPLSEVHLFPNPAVSSFQLIWNGDDFERLRIFDLKGRLVLEEQLNLNHKRETHLVEVSIRDEKWAEGIYLVELSGTDRHWTQRLVVQKFE